MSPFPHPPWIHPWYLDFVSNEKPVLKKVFFKLPDLPRTTCKVLGETVISIPKKTTEISGFMLVNAMMVHPLYHAQMLGVKL